MQGCHNRHAQFTQESENVAACAPTKNSIFELQANKVHIVDIQEVGGASIRLNIFFRQFEANAGRVGITTFDVVNGQRDARGFAVFDGDGLAQVGGKCGDTALARQIVTDKGNAADRRMVRPKLHREYPSYSCCSPFRWFGGPQTQRGVYPRDRLCDTRNNRTECVLFGRWVVSGYIVTKY